MAQPNVAREPSMEEILASIRRIIESNDPMTDAAGPQSMAEAYSEDESDHGEESSFDPDQVANDAGMPIEAVRPLPSQTVEPAAIVEAPATPERSLSLADVAARVRAASIRQQEAHRASAPRPEEPVSRSAEPAAVVSPFPALRAEMAEVASATATLPMPALRPAFEETTHRASDEAMDRPATEASKEALVHEEYRASAVESEQASLAADEFVPEPATANLRDEDQSPPHLPARVDSETDTQMGALAGLLSEAAGAQVAKSFGELADVFDGLERRSVEDMAQDMLRPMLQEWLDDNLPTLVERLVREEIERVARGPRR